MLSLNGLAPGLVRTPRQGLAIARVAQARSGRLDAAHLTKLLQQRLLGCAQRNEETRRAQHLARNQCSAARLYVEHCRPLRAAGRPLRISVGSNAVISSITVQCGRPSRSA